MRTPTAALLTLLALAAPLDADEPAPAAPPPPARRPDPAGLPPPVVRRPGERAPLPPAAPSVAAPDLNPPMGPASDPVANPNLNPVAAPDFNPNRLHDRVNDDLNARLNDKLNSRLEAPASSVPATGPAILDIVKNHNLPVSDGTLALRLDVRFRADGPAGSAYRVWIHFHDNATGQPVKTARASFGDLAGAMYVVTKPVQHAGGTLEYVAPLWVPYNAFPDPGAGHSMVVDASASLTQVVGDAETPLGSSATSFRVHGPDAPAAPATAPAAAFPEPR